MRIVATEKFKGLAWRKRLARILVRLAQKIEPKSPDVMAGM
jgi:hypothetical protein